MHGVKCTEQPDYILYKLQMHYRKQENNVTNEIVMLIPPELCDYANA